MTTSRLPLIETEMKLERSSAVGIVIPASFFGTVLGLVGLGNVWRAANNLWNLPSWVGETTMLLAFIVWTCLLLLYLSKWIWHRKESLEEVKDPVQCCFIGLVPVSTLLVALPFLPYSRRQPFSCL